MTQLAAPVASVAPEQDWAFAPSPIVIVSVRPEIGAFLSSDRTPDSVAGAASAMSLVPVYAAVAGARATTNSAEPSLITKSVSPENDAFSVYVSARSPGAIEHVASPFVSVRAVHVSVL